MNPPKYFLNLKKKPPKPVVKKPVAKNPPKPVARKSIKNPEPEEAQKTATKAKPKAGAQGSEKKPPQPAQGSEKKPPQPAQASSALELMTANIKDEPVSKEEMEREAMEDDML